MSKSKCTKHLSFGALLAVELSKKCTPLRREAHFQVKMYKAPQLRSTFSSWAVEKVHAVVARSTFPGQNVQSTPTSDHFGSWDVEKVRAIVARVAHFQVKSVDNWRVRTTFWRSDVEKVYAVVARSRFGSQKCQKLCFEHFWRSGVEKVHTD